MYLSPIETLYDRIIATFENTNDVTSQRLQHYTDDQLSRYIRIDTGIFSTPVSNHDTKEVVLNRRFLSMVWCLTYIIFEVAANKARSAIEITETYRKLDDKDEEVQRLDELIRWALDLKTSGSEEWPSNLPMPTSSGDTIRMVNVIFIDAITYIMFHEVAHLVNNHWSTFKAIKQKLKADDEAILTEEESALSIQFELEADTYAYDSLIDISDNEVVRYHKLFGMIIAGLSSLFSHKVGTRLASTSHPSTHVRVYNTRLRMSFDEGNEFRLNQVMIVGLSIFCKLHYIIVEDKGLNTDVEILDYLFDLIEEKSTYKLQY